MEKIEKAIIVDLDGTLSNVSHRLQFVQSNPKNWEEFNANMIYDSLNSWCYELIFAMKKQNCKVIFITGRDENYRVETEKWLLKHNVDYDHLLMRRANDFRADDDVKEEIYHLHVKAKFHILFVVDDRLSVVKRWRELGLVCLQCDWGNF